MNGKSRNENGVKFSPNYMPYNRKGKDAKRFPGRIVGVIAVRHKGLQPDHFNPLVMFFAVSRYRKDYGVVLEQIEQQKEVKLPNYEKSLFDSCFKHW
jgi:hypothetical protein